MMRDIDELFGGTGETLRLEHDTRSDEAYEAGVLLGLRSTLAARGVVVGLDRLLDLGIAPR